MSDRKYIGLDPGGTTGWCVRDLDGTFRHGVFGSQRHHRALWDFLWDENEGCPAIQIICEVFNYQRRALDKGVSVELVSRNYIGVVELFSQMSGVPLYMAQLGNKEFFNDKNLRDLNMYYPTQHERDAAAHLLWFITNVEKDHQYLSVKRKR